MILTHEQAHTAHKIMLLAQEGGTRLTSMCFHELHVYAMEGGYLTVQGPKFALETYPTLADFAAAYDVAGTAQRLEYVKAAQDWAAFCKYRGGSVLLPCTQEQFERLSVTGRVTKMILGVWA